MAGYEVYQLHHKSAADVEKVLADLLRDRAPQTHLVVDPRSNRLLLRGPDEAQQIARQLIDSLDRPMVPAPGKPVAASQGTFVELSHTRVEQVESTLRELLGPRLRPRDTRQPGRSHYWFLGPAGPNGEVVVDRQQNGLLLFASESLTRQLAQLVRALDRAPSPGGRSVRIMPLRNADPAKIRQAYEAYRSGYRHAVRRGPAPAADGPPGPTPARPAPQPNDQSRRFPHGGLQQVAYLFQPAGDLGAGQAISPDIEPGEGEEGIRDVGVDVEIETLPDLDVIIVRGRERDVEEVARIIEEIERLSALAEPAIEIYPLKHVGGEKLVDLVQQIQEQLVGSRQGRVSITPLVKPNALLLIGWGEAVGAVK